MAVQISSPPSRPYDQRLLNIGTTYGPGYDTAYAGDSQLAGTSYATGCSGTMATNGPVPGRTGDPLGTYLEEDGTIKRYFMHGNETVTDSYCKNDGITESKYQALLDAENSAAKNYCEDSVGGKHYLKEPNCGYVRQVSRPVGVDIWFPEPDPPPVPDCPAQGQVVGSATVVANSGGTVFGSGPYSSNSDKATAAVHAGLIKDGDTARISWISAGPDKISNFTGSTQNGVTSFDSSSTVEGVISNLKIVNPGQMASSSVSVDPLSVNGAGASIVVSLDSALQVKSFTILGGGNNYQVGDTFEVTSLTFGGGGTPAILEVTEISSIQGTGDCGIDIRLDELIDSPVECENPTEVRQLTVKSTGAGRGIINGLTLLNPEINPNIIRTDTPIGPEDWNWYYSCPPSNIKTYPNSFKAEFNSSFYFQHFEGPSLGEDHDEANFNYNWEAYLRMTDGCNVSRGGPIKGLKIKDPGARLYSSMGTSVIADSVYGDGAKIEVTLNDDGEIINYSIKDAGQGYQVGDTFRVRPSTPTFGFPVTGYLEVTQITPTPTDKVNFHVTDVKINNGGGNFAVGDRFKLVHRPDSPGRNDEMASLDRPAIFEVTNITSTELAKTIPVQGATIDYLVEKEVYLVYDNNQYNTTVEQVIDLDLSSTTDQVLAESANETLALFLQKIARLPTVLEFQQWVRLYYDNGAAFTSEMDSAFNTQFVRELDTAQQVINVLSYCDRADILIVEDDTEENNDGKVEFESPDNADAGSQCIYDRNDFIQRAGTGLDLDTIWQALGSPYGPSSAGGGADVDQVNCPRPGDSELIQDNEPDMSDLGGLKIQRWIDCGNTDNPNLGAIKTEFVPCLGSMENCENLTVDYPEAVYDKDARVAWNDYTTKIGNYVKTTLNSTSAAINDKYLTLLGRPAEKEGMDYWYASATRIVDGTNATYYGRGRIKYNDGSPEVARIFVKETKNQNATTINNKYLDLLGRPAEQAGLDYWVNTANQIGITDTLVAIENAAGPELEKGGVAAIYLGVDAVVRDIEDAAGPELARGGVSSFKLFCEYQISNQIDLSWFIDTRLPPWWGSLSLNKPTIVPVKQTDVAYLKNFPATQTDIFRAFVNDNTEQPKNGVNLDFVINWPDITGEPKPGFGTPAYGKAVVIEWWKTTTAGAATKQSEYVYFNSNWADPNGSLYGDTRGETMDTPGGKHYFTINSNMTEINTLFIPNEFDYPTGDISEDDGKAIAFDESPNVYYYVVVRADNTQWDSASNVRIPTMGGHIDRNTNSSSTGSKFYFNPTALVGGPVGGPTGPGPVGGPVGPVGGPSCSNLSVTCGQNTRIDTETNSQLNITFEYTLNNASQCSTTGSAKVSIRKYWPCPVFGPPSGAENQWVKQKVSVPIVNGKATYVLENINTSKDDYLPTGSGDQTVDDPGRCHWVYVAYWEIDHPSINCNFSAWKNPGCDCGTVHNFLSEILCIQQQNCNCEATAQNDCSKKGYWNYFDNPELDIDPVTCLPYCDTSSQRESFNLYWCCPDTSPDPGVNCVVRGGGSGSAQECSADCPICEQTITVYVGDTTKCGVIKKPGMVEGGGLGINNGAFKIGASEVINVPNFAGTIIPTASAQLADVCNQDLSSISPPSESGVCAKIDLSAWVYLTPKNYKGASVSGRDCAVTFKGEDLQGTYDRCCDSYAATFECINLPPGWCNSFDEGLIESGIEEDCDAQVMVIANWYYKVNYKNNTASGLIPLKKYDNGVEVIPVPTTSGEDGNPVWYYYPSASGETMQMTYLTEINNLSYYEGFDQRAIPWDTETYKNIEIYLNIQASNDNFGNVIYHPPPAGFNEGDFGTDTTVSSPRPPWNIGTQGPGPKDSTFFVGKYSIADNQNIPSVDWTVDLVGCADAEVYDQWTSQDELFCGTQGEPGYYECKIAGIGQYYENWINYDGTTGGALKFGCDPWNNAPDPNCAPPRTAALFSISSSTGVFNFDYGEKDFPYGCDRALRVLWYVNGRLRSNGDIVDQGTGTGGLYDVSNALSCGNNTFDASVWCTDAEVEYTIEAVVVMNNSMRGPTPAIAAAEVNFDWLTTNGDPYNFFDISAWACKRGSSRYPVNIVTDIQEGDFYQVVLGSAVCTIKGNSGVADGKTITGLQTPDVSISLGESSWNLSNLGSGTCTDYGIICINEDLLNDLDLSGLDLTNFNPELYNSQIAQQYDFNATNYGAATLTANINNLNSAWPSIPGTSEKVVGKVTYYWEEKNNAGDWIPVAGGVGSTISAIFDGRAYRVTVKFDLKGYVPEGYTANPENTSVTVGYNTTEEPTQECPDGSIVPVGQPCPDDSDCVGPTFTTGTSPGPVNINNAGNLVTQINVNTGVPVQIDFQPIWQGLEQTRFIFSKAEAVLYLGASPGADSKTVPLTPVILPGQSFGQYTLFRGTTNVVSNTNTVRNYNVQFRLTYQCAGEETKTEVYALFSALRIQWGQSDQPYVYSGPECRYASAYLNASGCGSYVADWFDPATDKLQTYFMNKKDSVDIADRGGIWTPNSATNGNCNFCPNRACPTIKITSISQSPQNPKVGDQITLQMNYTLDLQGFTQAPSAQPYIAWQGDGVPCIPGQAVCLQTGAQVKVGPFTSTGTKTVTAFVTEFFSDPNGECSISESGLALPLVNDSVDHKIYVGVDAPPPPTEKPTLVAAISGDRSLQLVNGTVTGNYSVDYTLDEGDGYPISTRPVTTKWDNNTAQFEDFTYQRTFTSPGTYEIVCRVAKMFCKPEFTGQCLGATEVPPEDRIFAYDDASYTVTVLAETSNEVEPTGTLTVSGPTSGTLNNGSVTLEFSASATFNNGTYVPTSEPSRVSYPGGFANGTSATWRQTFTSAGTQTVNVRFRKNYCEPGSTWSNGACSPGAKTSLVVDKAYTVNIASGGPTGTKPTATSKPPTYNTGTTTAGCGKSVNNAVVIVFQTIQLTQGTGDYVWDDVKTTTGNWIRSGNTLNQTLTTIGTKSGAYGTTVQFYKNGVLVHSEGSGQQSWCTTYVFGGLPGPGPGGPSFNPQ